MSFYQPGRALRRNVAGQPCPSCGLTLHHADVWAYVQNGAAPLYAHGACFELLLNAATAQAEEDAQAVAQDSGAGSPLDAAESSIAQEAE